MDVGDETELGLLAVVDDVDAGLDLALDDIGNRIADGSVVAGRAGLAVGHHVRERVRARQTADMGGDDAFVAFLVEGHGISSVESECSPPQRAAQARPRTAGTPHLIGYYILDTCRLFGVPC